MKIRLGFVSNSSSSSFCILGVTEQITKKLINKLGLRFDSNTYEWVDDKDKPIKYHDYAQLKLNNGLILVLTDEDIWCCGISVNDLWQDQDLSFTKAQTYMSKFFKKEFGITVEPKKFRIICEQSYNG